MRQPRLQPMTRTVAVLTAMAVAGSAAVAQSVPPSVPPAKDTVFARKILMSTVAENMDELETMLEPGARFETAEAREHSNLISVLLLAFPHMFPAATNQWKDGASRDAALDTYASPDVWTRFADFYARSTAASQAALEASKAKTLKDFKAHIAELRTSCDGCHAAYMKLDK